VRNKGIQLHLITAVIMIHHAASSETIGWLMQNIFVVEHTVRCSMKAQLLRKLKVLGE
jgi:hypothetical protein